MTAHPIHFARFDAPFAAREGAILHGLPGSPHPLSSRHLFGEPSDQFGGFSMKPFGLGEDQRASFFSSKLSHSSGFHPCKDGGQNGGLVGLEQHGRNLPQRSNAVTSHRSLTLLPERLP